MKKIKTVISVMLVMAMLFAVMAISPVQAAVDDSEKTGGGEYEEIYLDPGDAYRENTKWYAWTWFECEGEEFEEGFWMNSYWTKSDTGKDVVMFDALNPNVVFVCVPDSVEYSPSWDDVIYQSPETEVLDNGFTYKINKVTSGEKPNIFGDWIWSDAPDDPYIPGDITHNAFAIIDPVSTVIYPMDSSIQIKISIKAYYYSYSANGSLLNRPNTVLLEFVKNNRVMETKKVNYYADDIGSVKTTYFYPYVAGTYTVRVGFAKYSISSIDDDNYVGQYTFKVLPKAVIGDLNSDNSVDVLDATVVQKHAVGKADLTNEQLSIADVNNDNNVDVLDAAEIQKFAAGKITEFKKKA